MGSVAFEQRLPGLLAQLELSLRAVHDEAVCELQLELAVLRAAALSQGQEASALLVLPHPLHQGPLPPDFGPTLLLPATPDTAATPELLASSRERKTCEQLPSVPLEGPFREEIPPTACADSHVVTFEATTAELEPGVPHMLPLAEFSDAARASPLPSARLVSLGSCDRKPHSKLPDVPCTSAAADQVEWVSARHVSLGFEEVSNALDSFGSERGFALLEVWSVDDHVLQDIVRRACPLSQGGVPLDGSPATAVSRTSPASRTKMFTKTMLRVDGTNSLLHPDSRVRILWDVVGLVLVILDIIVTPLMVFGVGGGFWNILDTAASSFWTLDLLIGAFAARYINGKVEYRWRRIASTYSVGWGPFDCTLVTLSWLNVFSSGLGLENIGALRGLRALRFLRLLRLLKMDALLQKYEDYAGPTGLLCVRVSVQCVMIIIAMHMLGCFWFWLGRRGGGSGWVSSQPDTTDMMALYWTSAHYALAQFNGSMEVYPRTTGERQFAVCVLLLATFAFSAFAGNITQLILSLAGLRKTQQRQDAQLIRFIRERHVSHELVVAIRFYLRNRRKREYLYEREVEVLQLLPARMLQDVHINTHAPALCTKPVFRKLRADFPALVRDLCHRAVHEVVLNEGEIVFARGEVSSHMFVVSQGLLAYRYERAPLSISPHGLPSGPVDMGLPSAFVSNIGRDGAISAEMQEDWETVAPIAFISEAALWMRWYHRGTATSRLPSLLIALDSTLLAEIARTYEEAMVPLIEYARRYQAALNLDYVHVNDLFIGPGDGTKERLSTMDKMSSTASRYS